MHDEAEQPPLHGSDRGAAVDQVLDRRRPDLARFHFEPDPRRLRALLAEVDADLASSSAPLRRNVRLLIGEIVARLLDDCNGTALELDLEVKADSVRIDIYERDSEGCGLWEALDDVVFSDLTIAWGRDRRRGGGAWFEVSAGR